MNEQQEREANQFAMELLIPEQMLRRDVMTMYPDGLDVEGSHRQEVLKLALQYEVSEQLMCVRLIQLGLLGG